MTAVGPVALACALLLAVPAQAQDCALAAVSIEPGMARAEVESRIATALGRKSTYSPFANNLRGGHVDYRADVCTLRVGYVAGAAAPSIAAGSGVRHLPPKDETVGSSTLFVHRSGVTPNRAR